MNEKAKMDAVRDKVQQLITIVGEIEKVKFLLADKPNGCTQEFYGDKKESI